MVDEAQSLFRTYLSVKLVFPQTTVKIVPGSGHYKNQEAIENRPDGKYYLSNHRNTKAKVFNPPHSKRFNKSSTHVINQLHPYLLPRDTIRRITSPLKESMCFPIISQLDNADSSMAGGSHSLTSPPEDLSVS